MKLFFGLLIAAVCLGIAMPAVGQGSNGGILYASDFNQWTLPQGTGPASGTISWPSAQVCQVSTTTGYSFTAPKIGRKLTIVDGAIPAHTETVTPTQVIVGPGGCSISATMAYTHLSYTVKSGTAGLQEAIDYQTGLPQGSLVVVTPTWTLGGGTTSFLTSAYGTSLVTILDARDSCLVAYSLSGSTYAEDANFCSGGLNQLTGDVTAGPGSGSVPATLATVNSSPGSCGDATHTCDVTVNAKGLTTAQTPVAITFPSGLSYTSPTLNAIPKVGNATAPGTLVNSSLSDSGTVVSTAEQVNLGTLNVANSAVVIASQSGGTGYGPCTVNLSGGTCITPPTYQCVGVGSVPQQAKVFPLNSGGSCSISPSATISGPGGASGATLNLQLASTVATAASGSGVIAPVVENGGGALVGSIAPSLSQPTLSNPVIAENIFTLCSGALTQIFNIQSGSSLDLYGGCGSTVNMGATPAASFSTASQGNESLWGGNLMLSDYNVSYGLFETPNEGFQVSNTGNTTISLVGAVGGTGYTGAGSCAPSGGRILVGAGDTCSTSLSGGVISWALAGTTTYSVLPTLSCSGATGGTGAICPGIESAGTPSTTGAVWLDPTQTAHIGTEAIPTGPSTVTSPGTIVSGDMLVLGPTSAAVPALAAGSGHACLQVDTSGIITNTAAACGGSGTFNALTGDVTSTSTGGASTVQGLKGTPFCTGFTPTNGQAVEYTTGSSPNPCYTAATPSGGGTTTNPLTLAASGGVGPGGTFNGSVAVTADYHSFGAPGLAATTNTYTGTTNDFSGTSQIKFPVASSYTSAANGEWGYDSANFNWHGWVNGADALFPPLAASFVSGHCAQPTKTGNTWAYADSGAACGASSMVYPGAGVPVSTGSAWATSKTLGGTGTGIPTGPTSTTGGDAVVYTGTAGQQADAGFAPAPAVTFTDESSTFTPANNGAYFVTASVSTATPAASAFTIFTATTSSSGSLALTGTAIADGGNCSGYIVSTTLTLPASETATIKSDGTTIRATCTAASGSTAFSAITSGTNTTAAMVVGSGGSLAVPTQTAGDDSTKAASTAYTNTVYTLIESSGSPYTMSAITGFYWNSVGAYSWHLPTPVAGLQLCFGSGPDVTSAISLIPGSGVTINFQGVAGTTGSSTGLVSGGGGGDFICLVGYNSTNYNAIGAGYGTWTNH